MTKSGDRSGTDELSFWLETCDDDLTPRPSLDGDLTVDVAILGGGFSGLWTAYHLLKQQPDLEIAIIEAEVCGYGASGRNGAWCSPRFPVDAHALIGRFGAAVARDTLTALQRTVVEIGEICKSEGINAQYRNTGLLGLARSEAQVAGLASTLAVYERLGLASDMRMLSAEEAYERVHATKIHAGLLSGTGATVHPGRLVRRLARTVERHGARIFERTPATDVTTGADAAILTERGRVRARKAVVAAGEAYLTRLPKYRRALLPMSSMIILSEPLNEAQWQEIGWQNGESLSSLVHTKNYLTRTADGRILYGSRGAPYAFGSRMSEQAVRDEATFAWMRGCVREWWPVLEDVRFTHAWGGYLGVPRDWMPTVSFAPASRSAQLGGYTGRGVSTSALSAKLLAGLILNRPTGLESLPFHRSRAPSWEPEPLRWMGVRYVQNAFTRIDEAERVGRRRPLDARLAESLGDQ